MERKSKTDWWFYNNDVLKKWLDHEGCKKGCSKLNLKFAREFKELDTNLCTLNSKVGVTIALVIRVVNKEDNIEYREEYSKIKYQLVKLHASISEQVKLVIAIRYNLKEYIIPDKDVVKALEQTIHNIQKRILHVSNIILKDNLDLTPMSSYIKYLEGNNLNFSDELEKYLANEANTTNSSNGSTDEEDYGRFSKFAEHVLSIVEELNDTEYKKRLMEYMKYKDKVRSVIEQEKEELRVKKIKEKAEVNSWKINEKYKIFSAAFETSNRDGLVSSYVFNNITGKCLGVNECWIILVAPVSGSNQGTVKFICDTSGSYSRAPSNSYVFTDEDTLNLVIDKFIEEEPYAEYRCVKIK